MLWLSLSLQHLSHTISLVNLALLGTGFFSSFVAYVSWQHQQRTSIKNKGKQRLIHDLIPRTNPWLKSMTNKPKNSWIPVFVKCVQKFTFLKYFRQLDLKSEILSRKELFHLSKDQNACNNAVRFIDFNENKQYLSIRACACWRNHRVSITWFIIFINERNTTIFIRMFWSIWKYDILQLLM